LNATFSPTPPIPGHVAFISQSGALGVAVLELALRIKLGFSLFVSTGNKADIGDFDVLTYAAQDENTRVIALYQESIDTPDKFRRLAQGTVPDKPILVLKAGRTESGLRAASSHTGALASSDALTDAFLHQCGILRCNDLQEMLYSAYALASQPHPAGNRVGVITNAGGPGILASDALERAGMLLGQIESGTLAGIQQILPAEAGVRNPFDMIASADHNTYYAVFELLEKDPNIDIVMVIIVKPPVDTTPARIVQTLAPLIRKSVKPVYFVLMADPGSDAGLEHFQELGVPVVPYPELAAEIIGNHYRYTILRRNVSIPAISAAATARPVSGGRQAGFHEIAARLEKFDLELAPYQLISHPEEAAGFLKEHKTVVLKVADPEFIHKSDQGLVHLNIGSRQSLNLAFSDLEQKIRHLSGTKKPPEVLIQKMVTGGIELVMGSKSDAVLGPTIMFGIGGIFIELYRDVIFRVLPVTPEDCLEMIESVRGRRIFDGFRNFPAVDKQLLAGAIFRFGELVLNHPDIIEMDLNPVIWSFDQAKPLVVDARMTITI
jgi:acetyltransferase